MEREALTARLRAARRRPLWSEGATTRFVDHGRDVLEQLLEHRAPFLLLDAVTAHDPEQRAIRGRRRIEPSDPVFIGHFPGHPVYPGVLEVEMMGQLALCSIALSAAAVDSSEGLRPCRARAVAIHEARFLAEVRPGDQLDVLAQEIDGDELLRTWAGQVVRGDTVVSVAGMEVYLV